MNMLKVLLESQQAILESLSEVHVKQGNGRAAKKAQDVYLNIHDFITEKFNG